MEGHHSLYTSTLLGQIVDKSDIPNLPVRTWLKTQLYTCAPLNAVSAQSVLQKMEGVTANVSVRSCSAHSLHISRNILVARKFLFCFTSPLPPPPPPPLCFQECERENGSG